MEYTLCDINEEGFLNLMDEDGNCREDINASNTLPEAADLPKKWAELCETVANDRNHADDEMRVIVMKAMGQEIIFGFRTNK